MSSNVIIIDTKNIVEATKEIIDRVPVKVWREARRKGALRVKGLFYKYLPEGRPRVNRGRKLRSSATMKFSKNQVEIYPNKKVGSEFGQRLYLGTILEEGSTNNVTITPRRAKYLRFNWHGREWRVRSVKRGTIPPQNFMGKIVSEAREEIPKIYTQELLKYIRRDVK